MAWLATHLTRRGSRWPVEAGRGYLGWLSGFAHGLDRLGGRGNVLRVLAEARDFASPCCSLWLSREHYGHKNCHFCPQVPQTGGVEGGDRQAMRVGGGANYS